MNQTEKPPRVMRSFGATLMSVNGMIGAGIFALPALLYNAAGNFSPWLFLIFGLFYACNVLVVARLASLFRASGGPQLYTETAFGPFTGFQVGWILVIAMAAGRAATLYVLVSYLAVFFPFLEGPVARPVAMLALLSILSGISISGMRNSITGLGVGTALKLTPILILCAFGIARGNVATELVLPDFETFESVALLVFFAFSGTISATFCAGEVEDPRRTIPRSMLLSLAAIILLYMLVQFAYITAGAPNDDSDATPLAAAAGVFFGRPGLIVMTLGAIFSIATNALTFFISGPRVIYAMADRGLLPHSLSGISERYRTPQRAIVLFTLIVAGIAITGAFAFLVSVMGVASLLASLVVFAAFVALHRPGKVSFGAPLTPTWIVILAIAVAFSVYAIVQAPLESFALVGVLIAIGTVLYWATAGRRTSVTAA